MKTVYKFESAFFWLALTTLIILFTDGYQELDLLDAIIERVQNGSH